MPVDAILFAPESKCPPAGGHFNGLGRGPEVRALQAAVRSPEITPMMSLTTASTSLGSSASAMTRISGSVPDGRITKRPLWPSRLRALSMAALTGALSSGLPPEKRTF